MIKGSFLATLLSGIALLPAQSLLGETESNEKKMISEASFQAAQFTPANPKLPRAESVPAQLSYQEFVSTLGKLVYYWGYPLVDVYGRTQPLSEVKQPGVFFGLIPLAPINQMGYLSFYLPSSQRWVVSPNHDTIYGNSFIDLNQGPVVVQAPIDVPGKHYWTIQIADAFTNVIHQLGSRSKTKGGKYLLVGPDWQGKVDQGGFVEILRSPTHLNWIAARSFMALTNESQDKAIQVLSQIGVYPLTDNKPGFRTFDVKKFSHNQILPPGVQESDVDINSDRFRPQWVNPQDFWSALKKAVAMNPQASANDQVMLEQSKVLINLYESDPIYKDLLDRAALEADTQLKTGAHYQFVGTQVGNGWQRQHHGGIWGTNWFGRAQAAVIYIMVNDYREALYFLRATDAAGQLLDGKNHYTITFAKDTLPPVNLDQGGFWSLTVYDREYFMLADPANGRNNLGSVNLDANQLKFNSDGSLTIYLSSQVPSDSNMKANWLPTPADHFSLLMRVYVPKANIESGAYVLPNVVRVKP